MIYNSLRLETAEISTKRWLIKLVRINPQNGILCKSSKNEKLFIYWYGKIYEVHYWVKKRYKENECVCSLTEASPCTRLTNPDTKAAPCTRLTGIDSRERRRDREAQRGFVLMAKHVPLTSNPCQYPRPSWGPPCPRQLRRLTQRHSLCAADWHTQRRWAWRRGAWRGLVLVVEHSYLACNSRQCPRPSLRPSRPWQLGD